MIVVSCVRTTLTFLIFVYLLHGTLTFCVYCINLLNSINDKKRNGCMNMSLLHLRI